MSKYIAALVATAMIVAVGFIGGVNADSPGMSPKGHTVLFAGAVPTNSVTATVTTNALRLSGYVDGLWLDVAGTAGQTSVVTVATTTDYGDFKSSRTIYQNTAYTSADDGYCPIRIQAKSTAGAAISGIYLPIHLMDETVYISVGCHASSPGTGVTFRAVLVMSP